MRQAITNINLSVTTFCSMRCPDCCCDITAKPANEKSFFDLDYFKNVAKYFQGMERVHLTGGEPTIHPRFKELAAQIKGWFNAKTLTIESNGWGFTRFPEAFEHFDDVRFSHYTDALYKGAENGQQLEFLKNYYAGKDKPKFLWWDAVHIPRERKVENGKMCTRGTSETVAVCDNLIFPCCVGPGVYPRNAIPLCMDWREKILEVFPPCSTCFFAE